MPDQKNPYVPGPHPVDIREINPQLIAFLVDHWGIDAANELEVLHAILALILEAVFNGRQPLATIPETALAMIKEV